MVLKVAFCCSWSVRVTANNYVIHGTLPNESCVSERKWKAENVCTAFMFMLKYIIFHKRLKPQLWALSLYPGSDRGLLARLSVQAAVREKQFDVELFVYWKLSASKSTKPV